MARRGMTLKQKAVQQFGEWRNTKGMALTITQDEAYTLTDGVCGEAGSDETTSLAAVAVRYVARTNKKD